MSLLTVTNVSHGFGERTILDHSSFRLLKGEHIGLVGANGEGKTTFINIILGNITPDEGKIEWAKRLRIGYLDQYTNLSKGKTIKDVLKEAFKEMFDLEEEINNCYIKMSTANEEEINDLLEDVGEMQATLEHSGFYAIDARIAEVANGLGLTELGLDKDVTNLSGGQRSKVLLTKLLLENPDILILDEPTNFLDFEQINWLKNYLLNFENAFLLVSHDVEFMNSVVNVIYHIEQGVLTRYSGNYYDYMKMYEIKKNQINALYEQQQREIKNLEDFIARNKARVATRNMANSRQKKLDKMELVDKIQEKVKPNFIFNLSGNPGRVIFELHDLVIGYNEPLSKPLNFTFFRGDKIVLKGVNGIGKSTLLKSLIGLIPPISGTVDLSPTVSYGYFEQEVEGSRKTAMEEVWDEFPHMTNGEIHGALASCGLTKNHIESLMLVLSGGENAKVRLCKLMLKKTNVLILDEPTNHLDVLAKEALKEALISYKGSILLVCHEPSFYEGLATNVINIEDYTTKII